MHCGHAKGHDFEEAQHVSPLDPTCEGQFSYLLTGAILPKDDDASYMASLLKLDVEFLRNRRGEVLARVFDPDFIGSATDDELQALARAYRLPDSTGIHESFGHVVARFAERLLEGVA